ncbi:UbiA prenyltransferase family [Nemania abortiva]|nr:UbiA prenyltransferase family [Nemania abortiva]
MSITTPKRPQSTGATPNHSLWNPFYWLSAISFHLYTIYLVCSNNIWDIIIPGLLFGAINSCIAPYYSMGPALSANKILASAPNMLIWSLSNLFLFCVHNQRHPETIAEDRLNKPWRPMILYLMHPICFLIASIMGGFSPYIILTLFHIWYNELDGASNGILKNIHNAIGFSCFFTGPLEVVTQHSVIQANRRIKIWLALLTAIFATTSHTQDFRDMEGDRIAGRRTIPLVFGDTQSRRFVALAVTIWTNVACWFWEVGWIEGAWSMFAGALVVLNLLLYRSREGDVLSWKLWVVWVQGLIFLPFF